MQLCTRTEFARAIGVDPRSLGKRLPKEVATLIAGGKHIPLYPFPQPYAAIAVNLGNHPIKQSTPQI
jgi:hypothetical protein